MLSATCCPMISLHAALPSLWVYVRRLFLPAYFVLFIGRTLHVKGSCCQSLGRYAGQLVRFGLFTSERICGYGHLQGFVRKRCLIEAYPFPMIDPILFALPLSVMAIVVVSWVTGRK